MKSQRMKRIAVSLTCLMALSLSAGALHAQDISKTKTKKRVDKKAQEEAEKRRKALSDRLNKKKKKDSGLKKGPQGDLNKARTNAEKGKLTPEQIDKLKQELEQKNKGMIGKLDQIIAGNPYSPDKPDWMFQKAELLWELRNWEYLRARVEYNNCLDAAEKKNIKAAKCVEPKANYSGAQKIYQSILQQYPSYSRLDEVIYRLGRGLIAAGKGAQAVSLLQRLVQNYPNSKYLPEAYLALGEFYFEKNVFGLAKTNYTSVLKFPKYSFHDYALYKLGWVHYNQQEYRKSINTFKKVVEQKDDKLGFQSQAINDLLVAFAAVEDGWLEARKYFMEKRGKDFTYKKMGQMAAYLEGQGNDPDAVKIYQWFIKERPDNKKIPEWMESIIVAQKREANNDKGFAALEESMNRFVAYLDPEGTWAQKNKGEKGAMSNASLLTEASLAFLASTYHIKAQKSESKPQYEKAAKYYTQFIKRFPNKPASFDMNFFLAEIYLHSLQKLEMAAKQYQKVVDLYKAKKIPKGVSKKQAEAIVRDSAYFTIQTYNELVKKHHPDSILVKMAEAASKSKNGIYQAKEGKNINELNKRQPLAKYEKGFVEASDQWSEMYPKAEETPTIDYVSAEIYKARGIYDRAVPRYENIILNAPPKHRYRAFAGASLLEANYSLKKWDQVEKWARYLLKNKIFYVQTATKLKETIAAAINEQAINLKNQNKQTEAAAKLIALAQEFPKSPLAQGALFNAAAIYETGDNIKKAIETYEMAIKNKPGTAQASKALFVMGMIFQSRADFDRSASYFERLATKEYREYPEAKDAIYNAGVLRRSLQQWDKAISTYESYLDLFPTSANVLDVELALAELEQSRKDWKASLKRFKQIANNQNHRGKRVKGRTLPKVRLVRAYTEMGLMHEKIKGKRWLKDSEAMFKKSIDVWSKLEEKDKDKSKDQASQAKFHLAERIYDEFVGVKLAFPMSALVKNLKKKGTFEQDAEKLYAEIIQMKSPYYVAASAYRIGQMYKDFSDNLYNLPMPKGLTPDQEDAYRGQLDEYAFPLQEKALKAFRTALSLALKYKAYNEWSRKSAQEISKLESEAYPITKQPGVETKHTVVRFTKTKPIVDDSKAMKGLKARKAEADRIQAEKEAAEKARLEEEKRKAEELKKKQQQLQQK